jgi:hypothetical protein
MRQRCCSLNCALGCQQVSVDFLRATLCQPCLDHLDAAADAGEQIVEVMSKAARQLTYRFHLL